MDDTADLRQRWLREDFTACEALAARLSPAALAEAGGAALQACAEAIPAERAVGNVVRVWRDRASWPEAHAAFDAVRDVTLAQEATDPARDDAGFLLLFVAENVARVLYNATDPVDKFDDDSGAWMLMSLATLLRRAGIPRLDEQVWTIILHPPSR
jgi:hypothetical protein